MKTQAYFENIQKVIKNEINKARKSLYIAIAWFTDDELFDLLVKKANEGIIVELIILDDKINSLAGINYEELNIKNGKLWQISNYSRHKPLMHNKFCVIDENIVINGSYNWTRKAKTNHESITIISDSPEIALDFYEEFKNIKEKYFGKDGDKPVIDIAKLTIRLETLKNLVILEDIEDVNFQLNKLKKTVNQSTAIDGISDVNKIIKLVENKRFAEVVSSINSFVNKYRQLAVYVDSDLFALKLEIKGFELNISSLEDEKTEIEKLLYEFELRYNRILGKLVLKLLKLKRDYYRKQAKEDPTKDDKFAEAEDDYQKFQGNYKATKDKVSFDLTDEEKQELKTKYRKASKMCHPDIVADEYKSRAEKVFVDLKIAYEQNDLKTINQILNDLKKGIFKSSSKIMTEKDKYVLLRNELINKRDEIEIKLYNLKKDETYTTLLKIKDWAVYFNNMKNQLLKEIENYEKKLTGDTTK